MDKHFYIDLLRKRRATKLFNGVVLDKEMDYIIDCGRESPSSWGFEPWKVLVIKNDSKWFLPLSDLSWKQPNDRNATFSVYIFTYDKNYFIKYGKKIITDHLINTRDSSKANFYKKLINQWWKNDYYYDKGLWCFHQCYLFLSNILNASTSINISSCPLEGLNYEKINKYVHDNKIINKKYILVVGAIFGKNSKLVLERNRKDIKNTILKMY